MPKEVPEYFRPDEAFIADSINCILVLNKELSDLQLKEDNLMAKIKFLTLDTINIDYVSELAQKNLGLIKEDNILVILDE